MMPLLLALSVAAEPGAIPVELRHEADGWRLYRGGEPYYVRGAVYWADPDGRFPLADLAARGGNSVRCGGGNVESIVAAADRLGLTVTVGLPLKMESVHGFDYGDAAAVAAQFEACRRVVLQYKDHPSVIAWGIGNELTLNYTNRKLWDAIEQIAAWCKEVDPHHLTLTVLGDSPPLAECVAEMRARCPSLDLLGLNHYAGLETIPATVRAAGWTKPYWITEWGPSGHWQVKKTRWKAPIEETSTEKAQRYRERYLAGVAADREQCLGSYVFFWQDKQETTHTWYGMFLGTGEPTGAVEEMQQLWSGTQPANRAPTIERPTIAGRTAYDDVTLAPGETALAAVVAADPEGDALRYSWEVVPEATNLGYGGMGERKPQPVADAIEGPPGPRISLRAPAPGAYRLFVTVRDGQGNAAVGNVPFLVEAADRAEADRP